MNVLIVDDNKDNIYSVQLLLDLYFDTQTYTASSAYEANEVLNSQKIDLMLLDIQMPNVDGLTFAQHLRETLEFKNLPIVFVSGINVNDNIKKEIIKSKAFGFIEKPLDVDNFKEVLDNVMGEWESL